MKQPGGVSQIGGGSQGQSINGEASMQGSGMGGTAGSQQKPYSDKVDLNDLEWEDRERVLRLLFSKMNAGVPVTNVAQRQQMKQA